MADDVPPDRAARNQSLVRSHNERIEATNAVYHWVNPPFADWICECAGEACSVPVRLTVAEYEAVRANGTHFLVAPNDDHVVLELERQERYWIVEMIGWAAEVSEKFDPRSRQPNLSGRADV